MVLRFLFIVFVFSLSHSVFGQAKKSPKTTPKSSVSKTTDLPQTLPQSVLDTLKETNTIEVTLFNSSKSLSLQGIKNSYFVTSKILNQRPKIALKPKAPDAYLMFMVKDQFYVSAYLTLTPSESYLTFDYLGQKYSNSLTKELADFFYSKLK